MRALSAQPLVDVDANAMDHDAEMRLTTGRQAEAAFMAQHLPDCRHVALRRAARQQQTTQRQTVQRGAFQWLDLCRAIAVLQNVQSKHGEAMDCRARRIGHSSLLVPRLDSPQAFVHFLFRRSIAIYVVLLR